jgi:putative phage-type endonuclease
MSVETKSFDYFGDAVAVGEFEPGSAEWLELRRSGVGGSDVASILGWSKWSSAYALWASKRGLVSDSVENEAMEWGSLLEPVIREKFARKHPEWMVVNCKQTFAFDGEPWRLANVDGFIYAGDSVGLLEIKTARFEDDWVSGVPLYYEAQVQWYLAVLGLKWAKVAVLFGGNSYREFDVAFDELFVDRMVGKAREFWDCVVSGVAPDWDGSASTLETVRQLHPLIEDGEVELGDLGVHLVLAAVEFEKAEEHLREMKARTVDAMGSARYGVVTLDDGTVIRSAVRMAKGNGLPYLVVRKGK